MAQYKLTLNFKEINFILTTSCIKQIYISIKQIDQFWIDA